MSASQSTLFRQRLRDVRIDGSGRGIELAEALKAPPRYLRLRCYPGWVLVEAEAAADPGETGTVDLVYGPGALWLVDGTSTPIHALNHGEFRPTPGGPPLAPALARLDEAVTGPDYLRFFCGAVWGPEGPFTLVEDAAHPALGTVAGDCPWRGEIAPLAMRRDGGDLVADALVAYADSVFRARFRIETEYGLVTMEDDEPIAQGALPARRHRPPMRDLHPTDARAED